MATNREELKSRRGDMLLHDDKRRPAVIKRWQPRAVPADSDFFSLVLTLLLRWRPESAGMESNQGRQPRPSRQAAGLAELRR